MASCRLAGCRYHFGVSGNPRSIEKEMNNPIDSLLPFVPEKYRAWVVLAFAASPYITRTCYALMNGHGLKGVLSAIWLGTNTPKQLPVVSVTGTNISTGEAQQKPI